MKLKQTLVASIFFLASSIVYADNYKIDPAHSTVQFIANHLGFSHLVGRFNTFEGSFSVEEDGSSNQAVMVIDAASVDTNHTKRDDHLRSPDFFNAKEFPKIEFASTAFKKTENGGLLTGKLSLLGVTKPVEFKLTKIGEGKDPWGGYRIGYNATTTINRTDFGMNYMAPAIPVEIILNLFIEGIKE
ncbi:MAG: YceI family protein [Gammaproteobacteria bacterium]|nr:YceI family protein [Gammaproteobacteria bacterium]